MRRSIVAFVICIALAGCEKPELIRNPGDPPPSAPQVTNAAPVVNAGADQAIEMPFAATLAGTVSDDGQPNSTLTVQWSVISGPGQATFENAASAATTVTFSTEGTYVLQLQANDGEHSTADTLTVTVAPAVYPAPDLSDDDPDRGWLRVPPEEAGMSQALLLEAEAFASQAGGTGLISRYGRLVHSWGNIDQRFDVKSTTKSIGSIALGMLIDEGRVRLEDRAAMHLPTIGTPPEDNDATSLQAITLLHLATHTAGFEKTGGFGRLLASPGTQWRYSDGGLNWLADTLTTVYGGDLQQLFIDRLYPVIGINHRDDIQWRAASSGLRPEPRPNGIEHREFASGVIANVNALARVGLLFLRRGEWADHQRVISSSFVDLVRTPQAEIASASVVDPASFPDATHRYGVLWWTNATGALPNVPRDAYWAWGLGDSLIVVIPSLDLVIARAGPIQPADPTGRVFGEDGWTGEYDVLAPFLEPIVRAVQE
jgi:CubicO group peptidase (beta-lactamase class C family)